MDLLSSAQTKIQAFLYGELVTLLEQAVNQGDYGGGALFDAAAAKRLERAGADFTSLPLATAGDRALASSINNPLDQIAARYQALSQERSDFLARMATLLAVLDKESRLIDFLIAAAELEAWVNHQPTLSDADQFYWNLAASRGPVPSGLALYDPALPTVKLPASSAEVSDLSVALDLVEQGGAYHAGIGVPSSAKETKPVSLTWHYTTAGEAENLSGGDWTNLSLLEPAPLISIGAPVVNQILPQSGASWRDYFSVTGASQASNLPVFVRIVFEPRRRQLTISGAAVPLSHLQILTDDLIVFDEQRTYDVGTDFTVDAAAVLTPLGAMASKTVTALFTEYYPAFQCSINEGSWSQPVMLDPARPFPDDETLWTPVSIVDGRKFSITDELGGYMGLYLEMLAPPPSEMLLRIEQTRSTNYGATATLEVEFDRPSYMNSVTIRPTTDYPMHLRGISAEGLTRASDGSADSLFTGSMLIDRPITVRFDRRLVRRLYLVLYQESYDLKEHLVDPADKLKRDAMASLQAVLPFSVAQIDASVPRQLTGAQYDFGLASIAGQDWTTDIAIHRPGIFLAGPFEVQGTPEVLRFDAEWHDPTGSSVKAYLLRKDFYSDGTSSSLTETAIQAGSCIALASPAKPIAKAVFYLKFVLRDRFSILSKYLLQVAHV